MTKQFTRVGISLGVVLDGHFPVNQYVAIAARLLDPPPLVAREIVNNFWGQDRKLLVVINNDVRWRADRKYAPISKAGNLCW